MLFQVMRLRSQFVIKEQHFVMLFVLNQKFYPPDFRVEDVSTPGRRILINIQNMAGIPISVPDRVHITNTQLSTQNLLQDRAF